jgi:hypothetical protein
LKIHSYKDDFGFNHCKEKQEEINKYKYTYSPPASWPAYRTIYRVTGGFLNAARSILKRVSVRIFRISKWCHRSKPKLFTKTRQPKKLETICAFTERAN